MKDHKEQYIDSLLTTFDEMGFAPTTLLPDPHKCAIEWINAIKEEFERLENENAALRERLDKAVELPLKPSDFHIEPFFAEIKKDLLYENKIKVCVPTYVYFLFENEDKAELFVKGLQGGKNEHI